MLTLIKRNVRLFFRNKVNFLLSLLAIFIVVILEMVFLGNNWGGSAMQELPGIDALQYSWLAAGILAIATVTIPLGVFYIIVEDRVKKINKGFYASPLKKSSLVSGYVFAAVIVTIIASLVATVLLSILILVQGGTLLSPLAYLQILGIISLSSLAGTAMMFFITSLIKNHAIYTTTAMIIGTLVGFLVGIYIPLGTLGEGVQRVMMLFPPSHAALLFRQVLTDSPIQTTFEGLPYEASAEFMERMGITYSFDSFEATPLISMLILAGTALVFYGLSMLNMRRLSKR